MSDAENMYSRMPYQARRLGGNSDLSRAPHSIDDDYIVMI